MRRATQCQPPRPSTSTSWSRWTRRRMEPAHKIRGNGFRRHPLHHASCSPPAHHHLKGTSRQRLPQQEQPIVELSKVDYARMTVEADNYAWSKAHRAASADRAAWQERTRKRLEDVQRLLRLVVRPSIRYDALLEENRQQNATPCHSNGNGCRDRAAARQPSKAARSAWQGAP